MLQTKYQEFKTGNIKKNSLNKTTCMFDTKSLCKKNRHFRNKKILKNKILILKGLQGKDSSTHPGRLLAKANYSSNVFNFSSTSFAIRIPFGGSAINAWILIPLLASCSCHIHQDSGRIHIDEFVCHRSCVD